MSTRGFLEKHEYVRNEYAWKKAMGGGQKTVNALLAKVVGGLRRVQIGVVFVAFEQVPDRAECVKFICGWKDVLRSPRWLRARQHVGVIAVRDAARN